ncbi:16S rRNA (cytosine967-C5)-methyltransferase [Thermodesulfovibrio aggregans]|uniref:16S rRNA (cytosine(967)-C(5))-methyltransferase n=1 Tax=Thermodesulfovibrio aggregans TaxID=86166 RepID=A0A0U9HRE4_9BACT|nr:16S rRNA (cytosine(967)-C(5))-methyltransferase RsmB [Thermodesulfovibrio aggregans]GAQ95396.1 16S rRNA (cytosine967-C5)-methyltransferase [Thermodesulfovibrio aggregans]
MVYKSPRKTAVEILSTVLYKKKSLKSLLTDRVLASFHRHDRAFLIEVLYGTLRNLYLIDFLLENFFKNKKGLSPFTINNLRTAVYQLLFMKIPEYAVTFEAVNIEKIFNGKPAVVNAILRSFIKKYSGKGLEEILSINLPLSIKYSHPEWLIKRWLKRFSPEEVESLLKANNKKPPFTIAVKPEERGLVADYLKEKGFDVEFSESVSSGLKIYGQGYEIREVLNQSSFFWIVQDEASQLVCFLLEPFEDARVFDACASPGGKTLLTAALMKKGEIICIENNKERFKLLQENIERLKRFVPDVNIKPELADVLQINFKYSFDRIILDAPCSSTGVIRRNPDVRYRVSEEEIKRLSKIQKIMLEKVSRFLAKNSFLVYSVCSTEPEEGEEVIESFLQNHDEFSSIDKLRTYPHVEGTDGFFIAKLLRN